MFSTFFVSANPTLAATDSEVDDQAFTLLLNDFEGASDFITTGNGAVVLLSRTLVEEISGLTTAAASTAIGNAIPGVTASVATTLAEFLLDQYLEANVIEPLQIDLNVNDAIFNVRVQTEYGSSTLSIPLQ